MIGYSNNAGKNCQGETLVKKCIALPINIKIVYMYVTICYSKSNHKTSNIFHL